MIDSVDLIRELSNANGVSGFEDEINKIGRKYGEEFFHIKEDKLRNLYFFRKNHDGKKPVILIDAHSDEIGLMVKTILSNGLMKFVSLGGWDPRNLPGHRIKIRNSEGKYIPGIVASKPIHFMTPGERKQSLELINMVIDVGASSREEILNDYKIEPGAPVVPVSEFQYNNVNDTFFGKAFDDRLGCAAVLELLYSLKDADLSCDLVGLFSTQEEVGTRGVTAACLEIKPDVAIVLEGTPADDTCRSSVEAQAAIRKGPQIRHMDNSMVSNPRFVKFARDVAKENEIIFQDAVRIGGGTNGGKINVSLSGVPTVVIGVPVRYAHTHNGISSLSDYKNAVIWAEKILKNITPEIISGL